MKQLEEFIRDVDVGLSKTKKELPSKYFYDAKGSELFVQIMNLPEYYLTRSEADILKNKSLELIELLSINKDEYVELIELGSGDGTKTKELLKVMDQEGFNFDYLPIDISETSLYALKEMLNRELPQVNVQIQHGDYFNVLSSLSDRKHKKVLFFLGSNLGNYSDQQASKFLHQLGANLHSNDLLVLGLDMIKDEGLVLAAYNDKAGVTRQFNLNLLNRINRQLGGDFNLSSFRHAPEYCADKGIATSYLQSTIEQTVAIEKTGKVYQFDQGEKIHVEISRKYSDSVLENIIEKTDFAQVGKIMDSHDYFADYVLQRG
jgi:dimethylhistidine N-methyltransferase